VSATARSAPRRANSEQRRRPYDLTTYTFNTGVAKHTFCRHCGMHPFYQPRSDPENYSVNARCLDEYDPETMKSQRLFEGSNWEEAFARRGMGVDTYDCHAASCTG
jgi:hypothetical protein